MSGLARLSIAAALGATLSLVMPRDGVLAATQEIIAFLSLLMAGLLPAMILTATILDGSSLSVRKVDEYGLALAAQLRFWGILFGLAGLSALGIVGAKIFLTTNAHFAFSWHFLAIDNDEIGSVFLAVAGACLGGVMVRLYPAYQGLLSLLTFKVTMARMQAEDRTRLAAAAVEAEIAKRSSVAPYPRMRA
jgi:hypothetical protein